MWVPGAPSPLSGAPLPAVYTGGSHLQCMSERGPREAVTPQPEVPPPHQARCGPSCGLTTPEPRFIQTMVRDGLPVQAQLKTASEPRSTSRDWGSVVILGPTAMGGGKRRGSGGRDVGPSCLPLLCLIVLAPSIHASPFPYRSVLHVWAWSGR